MLRNLVLSFLVFPSAEERNTMRTIVSWCASSSGSILELENIKTNSKIIRKKYIRLQKWGFNLFFFFSPPDLRLFIYQNLLPIFNFSSGIFFFSSF